MGSKVLNFDQSFLRGCRVLAQKFWNFVQSSLNSPKTQIITKIWQMRIKKICFLKEKEEKRKASLPSLYQTHSNIFLLMLFLSLKITWTLNLHFPDMSDTGAGVSLLLWHNRHCHNHPHRPHHHPPHHHHPVCLILMPGCRLASLAAKIAVTLFSWASI